MIGHTRPECKEQVDQDRSVFTKKAVQHDYRMWIPKKRTDKEKFLEKLKVREMQIYPVINPIHTCTIFVIYFEFTLVAP